MVADERVIPYARNPRKLGAAAVAKVAASLAEFGWRQPIVVDSDGVVIVGHTRLLAAQSLGQSTGPGARGRRPFGRPDQGLPHRRQPHRR